MNVRVRHFACIALLCLVATGCGSRLTADRFDRVKEGMTLSQVKAILGKPNGVVKSPDKAMFLGWESGEAIINIIIDSEGKVFAKTQANLP
jgi:hypothetical protein